MDNATPPKLRPAASAPQSLPAPGIAAPPATQRGAPAVVLAAAPKAGLTTDVRKPVAATAQGALKAPSFVQRMDQKGVQAMTHAITTSNPVEALLAKSEAFAYALASGVGSLAEGDYSPLTYWLPDGYGVTVWGAGAGEPKRFRDPYAAIDWIRRQPDHSLSEVVFYGHGAPGYMFIGPNFAFDAKSVEHVLHGKMQAGAAVHLVGCNTASTGKKAVEPGTTAGDPVSFGLSGLLRRLFYFSAPYFGGSMTKREANKHWNDDLAGDLSARLPGVYVVGNRTFALPLDRFVPASRNVTPSTHIFARKGVYLDGETLPAKRAPARHR